MSRSRTFRKSDILFHIVKGWKAIVVCTIIGLIIGITIIGASYIRGEVTKEYRITTSVAVITSGNGKEYKSSSPDETNLSAARSLAESAVYIIKSQRNIEAVINNLGLKGVSVNDILRNITVSRNGETEIIEITLLWRSEKEGLSILNAVNSVTSSVMKDTVKMGYLSVINKPTATFIVGGNINLSVWIYAALVGLLIGIAFCILRFIISPTLINEDDITALFGIDTLGALPLDKQYARQKPLSKSELPIMDDIKSSAHLLLGHLENAGVNKLYVTSTMHDEGKTRLIADIALQLARLGKRTLLIDCNFQNPMLGALFIGELPYEKTLNALYRGDADKLDAVSRINGCLDLLPSVLERNPENFNDALLIQLKRVMEGYDYVLIDSAPVGTDAEVLRLNEITDTVLYIVRFDQAKVDDIKRAMERIAKSGIPVVGAIFNCVVNWRQTIINTPKRLTNSIKREKKRIEKEEKKRSAYHDKREKANRKSNSAKSAAPRFTAQDFSLDIEPDEDMSLTDGKKVKPDKRKLKDEEKKKKAEEKKLKAEEKKLKAEEKKKKNEEKKTRKDKKEDNRRKAVTDNEQRTDDYPGLDEYPEYNEINDDELI